jgi:hypothetical protein
MEFLLIFFMFPIAIDLMYVIARSAVPDSQHILTIGMKLHIIFLLHNTSSSRCTGR